MTWESTIMSDQSRARNTIQTFTPEEVPEAVLESVEMAIEEALAQAATVVPSVVAGLRLPDLPLASLGKARSTRIDSPTEAVNGMTQADLGDAWWQTIYSIPLQDHFGVFDDRTDSRGRRGSVERALAAQFDESVMFIGGAFGDITTNSGTDGTLRLQRSIILPNNGKSTVFFPILNSQLDNLVHDPSDPETGDLTFQQLQDLQATLLRPVEDGGLVGALFASVDGQPIEDPLAYRQVSQAAFSYTTPFPTSGSLLSAIGYSDETYLDNPDADPVQLKDLPRADSVVTIGPSAADGYWLAVEIKGGDHRLNFGGDLVVNGEPFFSLDTTYDILNPVYGTGRRDALTGLGGNDYMDGGGGGDSMAGGRGDDLMLGGRGNDLMAGGAGSDELWGDQGRDHFVCRRGFGADMIFDLVDGESIRIPRAPRVVSDVTTASGMTAALVDFGGGDRLTLVGIQSGNLVIQPGLIVLA